MIFLKEPKIERKLRNLAFKKDIKGLIKLSKYKRDWKIRERAISCIRYYKSKKVLDTLIKALIQDEASPVRQSAAFALGELKDKRAIEPLIQVLHNNVADVRKSVVMALNKIGGDIRAVEPLIQILHDKDPIVRQDAIEALGKIKDQRAIEFLIKFLKDKNEKHGVRLKAVDALGEIGGPAIELLIDILNEGDIDVQDYAIAGLWGIKDDKIIQPFLQYIKNSKNPENVMYTIDVLQELDEQAYESAIDILLQNYISDDGELRSTSKIILKEEIDLSYLYERSSIKEVIKESISIHSRIEEQEEISIVKALIVIIPRVLPYMMIEDDWYESGIKQIDPTVLDEETARKILKGILSEFLEIACKNLKDENLKKSAEQISKEIRRQGYFYNICPIGEVSSISESKICKVLMSLPITSLADPRRSSAHLHSPVDIYGDPHNIYNLNNAVRNIHSYWTFRSKNEVSKSFVVRKTNWGKNIIVNKMHRYSDGSKRDVTFFIVRLGKDEYMFEGSGLKSIVFPLKKD